VTRYELGPLAEMPTEGARVFQVADRRIAVFAVDGAFYALDDRCSHATASLAEGEIDADELCVECPRHGARFDLRSGAARTAPAFQPVRSYPLSISDGQLVLELI
jgi:3-phenylpropionate/trans-cinnamate dioxygenase ferredoxin component